MRSVISAILCMLAGMIPIALLRAAIMLPKRRRISTTVRHEAGLIIFAAYLLGLASQTVIPLTAFSNEAGSGINLIPGKVFYNTYIQFFYEGRANEFLLNVVGNILAFIPIGFCVLLLWQGGGWRRSLLAGFFGSLFIEICQLWLPRETDIDDIWLNVLGAYLGYLIYRRFSQIKPATAAKYKVQRKKAPL